MPAGGDRPESGGDSGLTSDTARAERARQWVEDVSLAAAQGPEQQHQPQGQQPRGDVLALPQTAGQQAPLDGAPQQPTGAAIAGSAHAAPQSHQLSPGAATLPAGAAAQHQWPPSTAAATAAPQLQPQPRSPAAEPHSVQQPTLQRSAPQQSAPATVAGGDGHIGSGRDTAADAAALLRAIQGSPPGGQQPRQQSAAGLQQPQPATDLQHHLRTGSGHLRAAAAASAARPSGAATAPAGGGLVAAAVLAEGVCSHDPATAKGAGKRRRRAESEPAVATAEEGDASSAEEGGASLGSRRGAARRRMMWTPELHARFMNAVNHLGPDRAVPKTILALMNVEGLTRENVASHLQKYRAYLKRLAGLPPSAPLPQSALQALQQVAMDAQRAQEQRAAGGGDPGGGEASPWAAVLHGLSQRQGGSPTGASDLAAAPPIAPLDTGSAFAPQFGAVPSMMHWGGALPPPMGYAGMLGVPQAELPSLQGGPAGESMTSGWSYPPMPPDFAALAAASIAAGPGLQQAPPQPTLVAPGLGGAHPAAPPGATAAHPGAGAAPATFAAGAATQTGAPATAAPVLLGWPVGVQQAAAAFAQGGSAAQQQAAAAFAPGGPPAQQQAPAAARRTAPQHLPSSQQHHLPLPQRQPATAAAAQGSGSPAAGAAGVASAAAAASAGAASQADEQKVQQIPEQPQPPASDAQ